MAALDILTSTVIVLEFCNISLFILLVLTPVPKHSLVKALIVSCLFRSVLDILPPIVHKIAPQQLGDNLVHYGDMASFCVADSLLLQYVTVVKAAFAVSFTLPCLWLSLVQLWPKRSADDYPRLTRRTVLSLCVAPFVWALPVLITPIPRIVKGRINLSTLEFAINSCYFQDTLFTVVSLVSTLVPLIIAVAITCIVGGVIWRFSETMLDQPGWQFVKTRRFVRFAGLVFITMISASLYSAVLVLWIRGHKAQGTKPADPAMWRKDNWILVQLTRTSVIWEAITPMLFFAIFAGQEEIYEAWRGWLSRIFPASRRRHGGGFVKALARSQHVTEGLDTRPSQTAPTDSTAVQDVGALSSLAKPRLLQIALPGKIVSRPITSPFTRTSHSDRRRSIGLSPPPRSSRRTSFVLDEPPRAASRTFGFKSMATFGSQRSMGSCGPYTSSGGDLLSTESYGPGSSGEIQRDSTSGGSVRPETPGSSRTFGRPAGGRK